MWKVFPRLGLLKFLFVAFSALFLSVLILLFSTKNNGSILSWNQFSSAFEIATPVTIAFIVLIFVIGKWGWLLIWKCPGLGAIMHKSVCPNLNGTWKGTIQSNYLGPDGNPVSKDVTLNINADIFGFKVNLNSDDNYQSSKVVQSEIYKDPRTNTFYLSYIFEAEVPIPEETDDRLFEGAAKLEVIMVDNSTQLKGTYWTNRAWQRKLNTAGIITAKKT